jgi:valyl-tRNA synthetase
VSTTRPETILGDTAVAVHPDDARYTHVVGKTAFVPMLKREIPSDRRRYVDPAFGTGALKVTPGHDPNDYEIGKRHGLPMINIMNAMARSTPTLAPMPGWIASMPARSCGKICAPPGWWCVMKNTASGGPLPTLQHHRRAAAERAVVGEDAAAGRTGDRSRAQWRIQIVPQRFERSTTTGWKTSATGASAANSGGGIASRLVRAGWRAFAARNQPRRKPKPSPTTAKAVSLVQDPDVLDTWFSSGLWPFSTLGWPEQTDDLATYYPTTVLGNGLRHHLLLGGAHDHAWAEIHWTGPLQRGLSARAGARRAGRKMSKSLGNVLDPLDLIAEYGADALRFSCSPAAHPATT